MFKKIGLELEKAELSYALELKKSHSIEKKLIDDAKICSCCGRFNENDGTEFFKFVLNASSSFELCTWCDMAVLGRESCL